VKRDYEESDDEAMPDADPALLASANRMLSDRLAGVAHALRGSGLPALADLDDGADMQVATAALAGAYQMAVGNLADALVQIDELNLLINLEARELPRTAGPETAYAIMLMDESVGIYPDQLSASESALQSLRHDPEAGNKVAVVEILRVAENTVVQRWA
jgi:hypothetical protein